MRENIEWIAVDWGTSNLRLWAINQAGETVDQQASDRGMNSLTPAEFEPTLLELISPWLKGDTMNVIACGMVGAKQGWFEAPYDAVPAVPGQKTIIVPDTNSQINLHIVAGLSQTQPADVMRGEETQIKGYLNQNPDFSGLLCLPGTHSKWATVSKQKVLSFNTAMTGELFALLSQQSVLRHSMKSWDKETFKQAVLLACSEPAQAMKTLFSIRADNLLHQTQTGLASLSGTLIGMELAGQQQHWLHHETVIIGEAKLAQHYYQALNALGAKVKLAPVGDLTLAGLKACYQELQP